MPAQQVLEIPKMELAIITGSSTWGIRFPEDIGMEGVTLVARDIAFETDYGLSENWKILEFAGSLTPDGKPRRALCIYQHGNNRERIDHACHQRTYAVLQSAGAKHILASSTIGSLNRAIQVGDFVINADIVELTQSPYSLLPGRMRFDCSGKQIVCPACAKIAADVAHKYWPASGRVHGVDLGLVAAHVYGPRLTTPAEVMAFRSMGADVINHSIAPEATLAREIGACFVPIAFVTAGFHDYFRPAGESLLRSGVVEKLGVISGRIALKAAAKFPVTSDCLCQQLKSPQPPERYSVW